MTISGYCSRGFSPAPSARKRALQQREGMRREIHQQKKENLNRGDDDRSVGEETRIGLVPQAQDQAIGRKQQQPEKERAFLSRPESCELIRTGKVAVAVVIDVGDGEIVLEGRDHQHNRR